MDRLWGCVTGFVVIWGGGITALIWWNATTGWAFWLPVLLGLAALGAIGAWKHHEEREATAHPDRAGLFALLCLALLCGAVFAMCDAACGVACGPRPLPHQESHWER